MTCLWGSLRTAARRFKAIKSHFAMNVLMQIIISNLNKYTEER
jgi:hypothetical protein